MGNMKSTKSHANHNQHGEDHQPSTLSSASSPSQAYETYIENGLICLKNKIRNIEKKKVTFYPFQVLNVHDLKPGLRS